VIVVLFVVLQGGGDSKDSSTTTTTTATTPETTTTGKSSGPKTTTIGVDSDGAPVGGVEKLTFSKGEQVRFAVRSDVSGDVHVHGYDIEKNVPAGKTVVFSFPADLEGVFDVESHVSEQQIAQLSVSP
jgi:hypothetical protein